MASFPSQSICYFLSAMNSGREKRRYDCSAEDTHVKRIKVTDLIDLSDSEESNANQIQIGTEDNLHNWADQSVAGQ